MISPTRGGAVGLSANTCPPSGIVGSIEGEGMMNGVSVAAGAAADIVASDPTTPKVTIRASTVLIASPLVLNRLGL
ncbi:MAG: hypothetical protein ACLQBB_07620 [Solirubrobacteraceae bacterium]